MKYSVASLTSIPKGLVSGTAALNIGLDLLYYTGMPLSHHNPVLYGTQKLCI